MNSTPASRMRQVNLLEFKKRKNKIIGVWKGKCRCALLSVWFRSGSCFRSNSKRISGDFQFVCIIYFIANINLLWTKFAFMKKRDDHSPNSLKETIYSVFIQIWYRVLLNFTNIRYTYLEKAFDRTCMQLCTNFHLMDSLLNSEKFFRAR